VTNNLCHNVSIVPLYSSVDMAVGALRTLSSPIAFLLVALNCTELLSLGLKVCSKESLKLTWHNCLHNHFKLPYIEGKRDEFLILAKFLNEGQISRRWRF